MTPAIRPQPQEASDPPPAPSAAHPGAQIAAGVTGSVAVTVAAKALGGSPWGTLVVALVGATVPVLISYTPRHRHLRLGLVLIVVMVAFGLTYGGFSLYDAAADKKTFPGPVEDPAPTATAIPTPDGGGNGNGGGPAEARVTPSLTCTVEQCGQVQIENIGGADLRVGDIVFAEDRENGFTQEGCDGETIAPAGKCEVDVGFAPPFDAGQREATLVVPTSEGDESVQLQGTGGEPAAFAFAELPECTFDQDAATTFLVFTISGTEEARPLVATTATGQSEQPVGPEVKIDLGSTPPPIVDVEINPEQPGAIREVDHTDNTGQAQCP